MLAFGHNGAGALIGLGAATLLFEQNPQSVEAIFFSFSAGLVSHYLLDAIPHGHYFIPENKFHITRHSLVAIESLGTFILFTILSLLFQLPAVFLIVSAMIGSQLPDIILAGRRTGLLPSNFFKAEQYFHAYVVHWHNEQKLKGLPWRMPRDLWQIYVFISAIVMIILW